MNVITIIIYVVLMPITLRYFFAKAREARIEASQAMSDEHFIIRLPMNFFVLGVVGIIFFGTIMFGFTLFHSESPDSSNPATMIVFYAVFGGFTWACVFLALRTAKFKVMVDSDTITVHSMFIKPYSFTFSEIISVYREEKFNRVKSELLEIKTITGKKFVVESAEISYERFLRRIRAEVKTEFFDGFE